MILQIVILALVCLLPASAYTQHNGVLILNNGDLSNITQIFPHLFVKYYVPWCRHCQQLAPIYEQLAEELARQNSTIRLAKIDCEENEMAYEFENIQHFPTLVFYNKGEPLNFDGDRTKSYILKWLTKRLASPVREVSKEELEQLASSESAEVSLVFHGALESVKGATFINVAYQDNYNNYYHIKEAIKPYGTVDILRSFAQDEEYPFPNDEFQAWIAEHDRPSVVPLDDRSISSLFRDGRVGVLLFLENKYAVARSAFVAAAAEWKSRSDGIRLIFVNVPEEHEDYFGLLEHMDVNPLETPIVIINSELQRKFLFERNASELTKERILQFLVDFSEGKVKESPLESEHAHHDHQHHHHDHDHDHQHHHHDHDHQHHHQHDHDHKHHHHHDHHHHDQHQHDHDHNHQHHHHQHDHDHDHDHAHHDHHHHDHHHHDHQHSHDHDHHDHEHHHSHQDTVQSQANKAQDPQSQGEQL